jgi:predicted lipoprotein with Yx(FWY)xxD motif
VTVIPDPIAPSPKSQRYWVICPPEVAASNLTGVLRFADSGETVKDAVGLAALAAGAQNPDRLSVERRYLSCQTPTRRGGKMLASTGVLEAQQPTEGSPMPRSANRFRTPRHPWWIAATVALAGGAATFVAMASASSFTLRVERNVHVTNTPTKAFRVKPVNRHEAVAVGPTGFAVYTFQGETTHHLICRKTNSASTNCWAFWPPVSPTAGKQISKQSGIKGKLGTFRNHGTRQLTLNGQPLYYFTPDLQSHKRQQATGDELKTFGSIWHVVTTGAAASRGSASPAPMTTTTTTTTTPSYNYSY